LLIGLGIGARGGGQEVMTREEVTFGTATTFSSIRSIAVDSKNSLYVLDSRAANIKVFDANGNLRGTIGKKGQGPGEFFLPADMEINAKDEIIVYDIGNHRISVFNSDGKTLRELSTAKCPRLFSLRALAGPLFVGNVVYYTGDSRVTELLVFDEHMETKASLAKQESKVNNKGTDIYVPEISYAVIRDSQVLWGNWLDNKVFLSDPQGNIKKTIPLEFRQKEITDSDKQRVTERFFEGKKPDTELIFPKYFPYYSNFLVAGDNVYFGSFERGTPGGHYYYRWKVGDRKFTRILLNPAPVLFKDGAYFSTIEDEQGNLTIKRISYQIKSR
jgi:hypothetical protein